MRTPVSAWWGPRLDGLCVFVGGVLGTALRALLGMLLPTVAGGFPLATLLVNLIGSFLLAVLIVLVPLWALGSPSVQRRTRLALGTGMMGGFTTFSTFALESVRLLEQRAWVVAIGYVAASLIGGLLAAAAGGVLARRLLGAGR